MFFNPELIIFVHLTPILLKVVGKNSSLLLPTLFDELGDVPNFVSKSHKGLLCHSLFYGSMKLFRLIFWFLNIYRYTLVSLCAGCVCS